MNNKICNTKIEVPTGTNLNDKDYLTNILMLLKDYEKNMVVALTEASNENLFKEYDAVILPVGSGPAKYLDASKNEKSDETRVLEEALQIGNFGGFPSITIPNGFVNNLPVGVNITGNCYCDSNVLNIAYALESEMNYKNQIAKEVK